MNQCKSYACISFKVFKILKGLSLLTFLTEAKKQVKLREVMAILVLLVAQALIRLIFPSLLLWHTHVGAVPHPMHETNEHTNPYGQRYPISCHAPVGVGRSEYHKNQYESQHEFHSKRLRSRDTIWRSCDTQWANRISWGHVVNYSCSTNSYKITEHREINQMDYHFEI